MIVTSAIVAGAAFQSLAMDQWSWMHATSPAGEKRSAQAAQSPLNKDSGGTCAAFSVFDFNKVQDWKEGGEYTFLGCLGWVGSRYSYAGLELSEKQLEKCGRAMFSTAQWTEDFDDFWKSNMPKFPRSWPANATLPVVIYSKASPPTKGEWQIQMFDELVLAFWKIYNYVLVEIERLKKEVEKLTRKGGASCPKTLESAKSQLAMFEAQASAAEHLSKNVVYTMRWAENEDAAKESAIQKTLTY